MALVYKRGFNFQPLTPKAMEHDGSKKQKRVEKEHWMLIVRATIDVVPNFHMVEVNKETYVRKGGSRNPHGFRSPFVEIWTRR